MNLLYTLAATLGLLTCVGHFTYGKQQYLLPMLHARFDLKAKSVLHFLFHAVSAFLVLSTLALWACAFEAVSKMQAYGLVLFIAMNYGIFAIWQLYLARISELEKPFINMFQWVLFAAISVFSLLALFTHK